MSALAVSQIQKHFITNQIYKRSRRYFDVIKLKSIQSQNSKSRRKPNQANSQEIQKNIKSSFMSSNDFFHKRREEEIEKSKKKNLNYDLIDQKEETETNYSVATKYHSNTVHKSFDMGKALSREFFQSLTSNPSPSIGDPFDNFVSSDFDKGGRGKSIDFNKILGRKDTQIPSQNKNYINFGKKKTIQHNENPQNIPISLTQPLPISMVSNVNINKVYEKNVYDQGKFRCLIDIQKQRKALQRHKLRTSLRQGLQQKKQLNLQSLQKGRAFSQKKPIQANLMFYHGKGMQQPSQMHLKTLKKNQNYWIEQLKIMKKEDFETVKRRQYMIQKRNDQIKMKRTVIDTRGQICDAKYFLRNPQI